MQDGSNQNLLFCVCRWESLLLMSMYGIYILIMKWVLWTLNLPLHQSSYLHANSLYCTCRCKQTVVLFGCRFNSRILGFVTRHFRGPGTCCNGSEDHREDKMGEEAGACNTSMVLLSKGVVWDPPCVCLCDGQLAMGFLFLSWYPIRYQELW